MILIIVIALYWIVISILLTRLIRKAGYSKLQSFILSHLLIPSHLISTISEGVLYISSVAFRIGAILGGVDPKELMVRIKSIGTKEVTKND